MEILVINAGSSSVKFAVFDFDSLRQIARGLLDWAGDARRATLTLSPQDGEEIRREIDAPDYRSGVVAAMKVLSGLELAVEGQGAANRSLRIRVVGHRLIHGGEEIRRPVRIDEEMKKTIEGVAHLAPLHIPAGLQAINAAEDALPEAMQVGLFDTAFFGDIPPCAYLYPVPYQWYEDWGIRRFGFHGTSHAYCTQRAAEMMELEGPVSRLVICHLGQGGSATAVRDGTAVTNTMGFTPLEGFMMGTRSGTLDPGLLLYVQREHGLTVDQLDHILHKESGLLGLSGVSSDFRQVEIAASEGHKRARLALDVYAYRVRAMVGALAVSIGGIDALVFTGGIGENSAWLRSQVCDGLECLGVHLDPSLNENERADADIAQRESAARVLIIHTREDLMIAREARRLALVPDK
ncbi:MAG: acetate/propionate family kinase [Pirellulales bacterium]|nr:acetate/propionate family kinase [Pirellulales bacterium]